MHGKSLLPQGKCLRHQIEAGNLLRCMEDEPSEEHEHSFKNTQRIIVISSALKASITAVIKKKTPPLPENSPQENPEKRMPPTEEKRLLLSTPACE